MNDFSRPNPDALLASLHRSDAREKRGRLKVFFGMAPGVGKTYAMLQAARKAKEEGVDVVVALLETHGRRETAKLLEGLEVLPRLKMDYKGATLEEMDLERLLARHPRLAIVDEFAHSNAPGARHLKRWQDVAELLEAGVDVYTTLNVQHLESRADTVLQITGIAVRETVPDSMIDAADDIQLVDLTPSQLRDRLSEGKVYIAERATVAADNFFKESNLTALRELALRLTADRVDKQLRDLRQVNSVSTIWKSGERLLVAVSPSPFSTRLIRWTRRMAYALDAPWVAVTVELNRVLAPADKKRLDENLSLARELGAEVVVVPGEDVAETLVRVALQHNVSQIVVGKSRGNPLFEALRGGSLVDRIVRRSGQIDIYVVPAEPRTGKSRWKEWEISITSRPKEYGLAFTAVLGVTLLGLLTKAWTGYWAVSLFYLGATVLLGLFIGQGPILFAAALSALTWNYLFIPPIFTFRIDKLEDGLMFGFFFVMALVTGRLTSRLRMQERAERLREQRATALYQLTRAIATAKSADEVVRQASAQIQELFGAKIAFFIQNDAGSLSLHTAATYVAGEKERGVAEWTFRNRRAAGRFTDTLPSSEGYYLPMVAGEKLVGVLGLRAPEGATLSISQRDLLDSFATQIALALDHERLRVTEEGARLAQESDKLHRTLLDSVSHELKTPLAVIGSAVENLRGTSTKPEATSLVGEIGTAVQRLQRLVNNLLDMTRLESGSLRPRLDWTDPADLINSALAATRDSCAGRNILLKLAPDLPLIRVDFALVEQSLVNLIHNACHHTSPTAEIIIGALANRDRSEVAISVADTGQGLSPEMEAHIFDKFYRGKPDKAGGLGLGLSIAQGFVEVHGGRVEARNQPGSGAEFTIFLPADPHGGVPVE